MGVAAVGDSHQVARSVIAKSSAFGSPERILKITEAQAWIGGADSVLKKETPGKNGFSVQDKVNRIHRLRYESSLL